MQFPLTPWSFPLIICLTWCISLQSWKTFKTISSRLGLLTTIFFSCPSTYNLFFLKFNNYELSISSQEHDKAYGNWKARSFQYLKQSCFVFKFLFPYFSMTSLLLVFNEPWFLVFWAVCEDSLVFLAINRCVRVLSSSLKENILFLLFPSTMRCFCYHHRHLENSLAFFQCRGNSTFPRLQTVLWTLSLHMLDFANTQRHWEEIEWLLAWEPARIPPHSLSFTIFFPLT